MSQPQLWSLEERNLYKLVTEVQVGGEVVDRYETPFGIRSIQFDAEKGFLLNGKSVKLKGTCNHQDHAGLGAALPDAVQYYRVRKLQEMGCNSLRTSHNPPTPGTARRLRRAGHAGVGRDAHDVVEPRRPEPVRESGAARPQPSQRLHVVAWGMRRARPTAPRACSILTAMKEAATEHDGSRPVSIAPTGRHRHRRPGGLRRDRL